MSTAKTPSALRAIADMIERDKRLTSRAVAERLGLRLPVISSAFAHLLSIGCVRSVPVSKAIGKGISRVEYEFVKPWEGRTRQCVLPERSASRFDTSALDAALNGPRKR